MLQQIATSLSLSFLICENKLDLSQPPGDAGASWDWFPGTGFVTWKVLHQPPAPGGELLEEEVVGLYI